MRTPARGTVGYPRSTRVLARLAAAILVLPIGGSMLFAPGFAQARGTLPKGTPYAAEVSVRVTGETYVDAKTEDVTDNVCEAQPAASAYDGSFDIHWTATYPHLVVPVADAKDLGKAYHRLHISTPSSIRGKAGPFSGSFEISGSAPATTYGNQGAGGSDCAPIPYSADGLFTPCTLPRLSRTYADLPRGLESVYALQMEDVCFATPSSYDLPDGTTGDPVQDLLAAVGKVGDVAGNPPAESLEGVVDGRLVPGWNGFALAFGNDQFRPLVRRSSLKLQLQDGADFHDCGSSPDDGTGSDNCQASWRYYYEVTLERRFLYRTKQAYPR